MTCSWQQYTVVCGRGIEADCQLLRKGGNALVAEAEQLGGILVPDAVMV